MHVPYIDTGAPQRSWRQIVILVDGVDLPSDPNRSLVSGLEHHVRLTCLHLHQRATVKPRKEGLGRDNACVGESSLAKIFAILSQKVTRLISIALGNH